MVPLLREGWTWTGKKSFKKCGCILCKVNKNWVVVGGRTTHSAKGTLITSSRTIRLTKLAIPLQQRPLLSISCFPAHLPRRFYIQLLRILFVYRAERSDNHQPEPVYRSPILCPTLTSASPQPTTWSNHGPSVTFIVNPCVVSLWRTWMPMLTIFVSVSKRRDRAHAHQLHT